MGKMHSTRSSPLGYSHLCEPSLPSSCNVKLLYVATRSHSARQRGEASMHFHAFACTIDLATFHPQKKLPHHN